ncbi:M23 family metallopeptidase [Nocardioides sp. SYSU D00038]|uniref:M23 family metallopeptidase n=1 Tax=Nocardioides sp. SYSU D00038 TaxID=2812554 RepID=UPI00196799BD|nr:M23 family metallopeptidase [Nocardioides sp. SYSU D00038]
MAARPVDSDSTAQVPYVGRRAARPVGALDQPVPSPVVAHTSALPQAPATGVDPLTSELPQLNLQLSAQLATMLADRPDTAPAPRREPGRDPLLDTGRVNRVLADLEPRDQTTSFTDEPTARLPLVRVAQPAPTTQVRPTQPGKRRAVKHAGPRGPLFKGLPSVPVLLGVATLAVSVIGAVAVPGTDVDPAGNDGRLSQATALSGIGAVATAGDGDRGRPISRDSAGQARGDAGGELKPPGERLVKQHNAALEKLQSAAQSQADKIEENLWVTPLDPVVLTARFGQYGLWSSYHTGLDFNGDTGDQIRSIANGVVTSTGYDGAYGNKTVVTLDDGTEIWYCHQSSIGVSPGEVVRAGEVIGLVGTTGNVTGSHLHLEVRPGGGDPVDPYAAFLQHGVDLPG